MAKTAPAPAPATKPAPTKPAAAPAGPVDITQLELVEILRKVEKHGGDRNSLSPSELAALHQHERFVRLKQRVTNTLEAAKRAEQLPQRNAAAFKAKLAGLLAARNKAGIAALVRDLENCQRLRDVHATKGDEFIKIEIKRHEGRIARLRESLKRSSTDALALAERIAAAKAALDGIDDANKCPHCGQRLSSKRNLDQHVLDCPKKPAAKPAKPAPATPQVTK